MLAIRRRVCWMVPPLPHALQCSPQGLGVERGLHLYLLPLSSSSATSKSQQSWYISMHPQYPNDNIRRLLRPGDSLVRREFGFLLSWDQSLFHAPGCHAELPCSRHVEHPVRLIICELGGGPVRACDHAAQQSQQIKGLFEHRRLSAGSAFMAGTGGARSSETPPVPDPNRFLAATVKERVTLAIPQQRWSACPPARRRAARQGWRTEGRRRL